MRHGHLGSFKAVATPTQSITSSRQQFGLKDSPQQEVLTFII
jgi:hypothetical protein